MSNDYPDPYGRSIYHGKLLDNATIEAVKVAEEKLGYQLTIVQGIGGAAASAGTHVEGRAIDVAPWDIERKARVLKDVGFAFWHRERIPGLWGEHGHGVLILESATNSRGIAGSAERQIASFLAGRDGLKGDRPDHTYRPSPRRVYRYGQLKPKPPAPTPVSKARDRMVEAIVALEQAATFAGNAHEGRVKVHGFIDELEQMQQELRDELTSWPKR